MLSHFGCCYYGCRDNKSRSYYFLKHESHYKKNDCFLGQRVFTSVPLLGRVVEKKREGF